MTDAVDLRGYPLDVYRDPDDGSWVAEVPDLPGAVAAGVTPDEAVAEVADAIAAWIEAAESDGRPVPAPRSLDETYSGRFLARVPKSLHRRIAQEAKRDGVSLNTYVVTALAQSVARADVARSRSVHGLRLSNLNADFAYYPLKPAASRGTRLSAIANVARFVAEPTEQEHRKGTSVALARFAEQRG